MSDSKEEKDKSRSPESIALKMEELLGRSEENKSSDPISHAFTTTYNAMLEREENDDEFELTVTCLLYTSDAADE